MNINTRDIITELDKRIGILVDELKDYADEYDFGSCFIENTNKISILNELRNIFISIETKEKVEKIDKEIDKFVMDFINNEETEFYYECPQCNYMFLEKDAYKWRINNRIVDCCPKCKKPLLFAKET